ASGLSTPDYITAGCLAMHPVNVPKGRFPSKSTVCASCEIFAPGSCFFRNPFLDAVDYLAARLGMSSGAGIPEAD
ncbi:hypothetical protein P7K49_024637, partial [Saguinus oedipus]